MSNVQTIYISFETCKTIMYVFSDEPRSRTTRLAFLVTVQIVNRELREFTR